MPNFYDRIAAAASRFPHRPAIELARPEGTLTTTYEELLQAATNVAAWLTGEAGVRAGDRVAILSANSADWVAAYLGILRAGAVAVPLDTNYTARQVRTIVADCGARVLFASERLEPVAREALAADLTTELRLLNHATPAASPPVVVARGDGDSAAILYTSGTTADPKGVVLTHGNLEAERAGAFSVLTVGEDDAVLGVLPLFHALAQMANLLLPLTTGARVVFLETVSSTTLMEALGTRNITIFACVPQFFYLVHQRVMGEVAARGALVRRVVRTLIDVSGWLRARTGLNLGTRLFARVHQAFGPRMRFLITGGSRFDPAIARDFYGMGLSLLNGYGLTETSGAATVIRPGDAFTTSVGHPLSGVEIRIAPDAMVDAEQASEGTGEILIRGPVVMREYFNRPDATREALDDGWLRTGDLGRLDAAGRLYITGRKKEVIVLSSGKNLYPEEIEAHYRQSPFIKEIAVLGVNDPETPAAERLHAVVVPDADALRARGIVNVRELVRFELEGLAVQLPAHKRVLSYDISTDALPRTTTGKLRRGDIERWHHARATPLGETREDTAETRAWRADARRRPLVEAIAERLDRPAIGPDDNLELDLHLDSMERVELLAALEERAGTRVSPDVKATIFTVGALVDAVLDAPAATTGSTGQSGAEWRTLLAAAPDAGIVGDLMRPSGLRALGFFVVLRVCRALVSLGLRVRIQGVLHLPRSGPFIITPNHQAYLDGFLLAMALPYAVLRQIFFVGASEYFETPLMKRLARAANIVPVDPDANLVPAMQAAAAGLRLGKVLILFPEGERSIDGHLKTFRKGAAILSTELDVPLVPVAISGLYELWPRGRSFDWRRLAPWRRHEVTLIMAPPMQPGGGSYAERTDALQQAVRLLLERPPEAR